MISDNSLVVQDTVNELGVAVHRLDRGAQVRVRLLLHGRQRRHPDRGRDVRAVAAGSRATARSACSGRRARRARDYADYFRDTALQLGLTITREVKLEPNPVGLDDDLADDAASSAPRRSTTAATATRRSTSPTAFKALDWDPPRVMGTAFMFYSNSQRVGRGARGLARRRPARRGRRQPELQRDDRPVRAALRPHAPATSSSRSPTTPPASPSTASPTPPSPRRGG